MRKVGENDHSLNDLNSMKTEKLEMLRGANPKSQSSQSLIRKQTTELKKHEKVAGFSPLSRHSSEIEEDKVKNVKFVDKEMAKFVQKEIGLGKKMRIWDRFIHQERPVVKTNGQQFPKLPLSNEKGWEIEAESESNQTSKLQERTRYS